MEISFHAADVSDLRMLTGPYDYVLDIGCLFVLSRKERLSYACGPARLTRSGGVVHALRMAAAPVAQVHMGHFGGGSGIPACRAFL